MLHEADLDLWVGDHEECKLPNSDGTSSGSWVAILHACKVPCHQAVVGYTGSLPSDHPEYLWTERGQHLVLNMIDAPDPRYFNVDMIERALDFLAAWHPKGPTLIHCNLGQSRSPSLALLYLAKRAAAINRTSFTTAMVDFVKLYAGPYRPSVGLAEFLRDSWNRIA